jgi:protein TonB
MSEATGRNEAMHFETLLHGALEQRRIQAEPPAGVTQRLLARLAQEDEQKRPAARPFAFAEAVRSERSAASIWFAVGAHAVVLVLLLTLAVTHRQVVAPLQHGLQATVVAVPPPVLPRAEQMGGGGGAHDVAPVSKGRLPELKQEQIVPPKAPPTIAPKLAVESSIVVQKDLKMADNTMPNLGDPKSTLTGNSFGNGGGGGLGGGSGNGLGLGSGGSTGGGVMHIGGSVLAPRVLVAVDPEFSEEARKAKFSGDVQVYLWVDEYGNPSHVRVVRGVGMGLDEKAVEAVRQYKFKPATQNGKPVKVDLYISVNFEIF